MTGLLSGCIGISSLDRVLCILVAIALLASRSGKGGTGSGCDLSCMSGDQPFRDAPNKRGGKKVKRKKELWELTEQGQHIPKVKSESVPIGYSSSDYNTGNWGQHTGWQDWSDWHNKEPSVVNSEAKTPLSPTQDTVESCEPITIDPSRSPPKAVPEVSGPEVSVSSLPEAPSSSGVLISEARPLELRPRGGPQVASTASSVAGAHPTIRLSLDLHGVLDLGSTGKGRWSTVAINQLANWLSQSPYHQASVYSYIGLRGAESKFRRDQALASVRRFNTAHNADLRIGITTDKLKSDIQAQEVSVHVDDKVEICRQLNDRGVPNICLNPNLRNPPPDLVVVKDIVAAFEAIERLRLVPRVWASQWPGIFKTG